MPKALRAFCMSLSVLAAILSTVSRGLAECSSFNCKGITIVVAGAAGSTTDIAARIIADSLEKRLGKPIVVENRALAPAAQSVANAIPDGSTLLMMNTATAVNATLSRDAATAPIVRDLVPIAGVARIPGILVVNLSLPVKTVPELIDFAKANPGKLGIASSGGAAPNQLAGELLKTKAGIDVQIIPFQGGGPALTSLLAGETQITFLPADATSIDQIKMGRIRALGVTGPTRLQALPDLPRVAETIPGYEASNWFGLVAPKNISSGTAAALNREINAALANSKVREAIEKLGGAPLAQSPDAFGKLIADETEKWRDVIKATR